MKNPTLFLFFKKKNAKMNIIDTLLYTIRAKQFYTISDSILL